VDSGGGKKKGEEVKRDRFFVHKRRKRKRQEEGEKTVYSFLRSWQGRGEVRGLALSGSLAGEKGEEKRGGETGLLSFREG